MSTNADEPNLPEEEFEVVEIDGSAYLTPEERAWPAGEPTLPEEEFAVEEPIPALDLMIDLTPRSGAGRPGPDEAVRQLIEVVSELERLHGGAGMTVGSVDLGPGNAHVRAVPTELAGARERLGRVARLVSALAATPTVARVA
ncbi:MAG: hypothetical protein JWO38_3939 [Gemmataceae bacterium]|nr:hypothetical protein [Gemmataceae bacterium]